MSAGVMIDVVQEAAFIEIERLTRRANELADRVTPLVEHAADVLPPELPKDCQCQHHDGPHWLHINDVWREKNKALLRLAADVGESDLTRSLQAYRGYLNEEYRRLCAHEDDLRRALAAHNPTAPTRAPSEETTHA